MYLFICIRRNRIILYSIGRFAGKIRDTGEAAIYYSLSVFCFLKKMYLSVYAYAGSGQQYSNSLLGRVMAGAHNYVDTVCIYHYLTYRK